MRTTLRRRPRLLWIAAVAALTACGGGGGSDAGGDPTPPAASCTVADQKAWLAGYVNDWYFWYRLSPRPDPAAHATVADYFDALLYAGTSVDFPADRWSYFQTTESFNRFYGDGQTLGYGLAVNGVEVDGDPAQPLFVRYVDPGSPAAVQGVQRGDQIIALNGTPVASVIASDDYGMLTATQPGQQLIALLRRDGSDRAVVLTAAVYNLMPVQGVAVQATPRGRTLGYLQVKDMIAQSLPALDTAFAQFKAAGVQDLVLDLRYNGGGLVSTSATLASYIAGTRGNGLAYATLLYNDKRAAANNQRFDFSLPGAALSLPRVYVLAGPRTCSASEQLINGLRGAGLQVVAVGDTTCGKPVGFLPSSSCGQTYSLVNFESVNHRNEGRYWDGFDPSASCAVAEDFSAPQGSAADPLLAAARRHADSGSCALPGAADRASPLGVRRSPKRKLEAGERIGMVPG